MDFETVLELEKILASCKSCWIIGAANAGMGKLDQEVYERMATTIVQIGGIVGMLAAILILQFRTQFGFLERASEEAIATVKGLIARTAIALAILSTFALWKDGLIGMIDNGIAAFVATAYIQGVPDNAAITERTLPGYDWIMYAQLSTENAILKPINNLWKAVGFSSGILSALESTGLAFLITVLYILAIIDLAVMAFFYVEYLFWRFLIVAFGPILIFAWVFDTTRPAAWMAMKLLFQAAITLLFLSGVVLFIKTGMDQMLNYVPGAKGKVSLEDIQQGVQYDAIVGVMMIMSVAIFLMGIIKVAALFIVMGAHSAHTMNVAGSMASKVPVVRTVMGKM